MQEQQKTSSIGQGLLWFGAAVSIAEILTGALIAPLGITKGIVAILFGHLAGGVIFYLAGYIGAQSNLSAIESTRISFGKYGSFCFSILNVLQLLGWTAVMIINGARALNAVVPSIQSEVLWCVVIGVLICVWIIVGIKNLSKVNAVVVTALLVFSLVLGVIVFKGSSSGVSPAAGTLSFGAAVELSITMPLSWMPLISDYTRTVRHKKSGTLMATSGYFLGSCMMYTVGLGAAIYAGTGDIVTVLAKAGMGAVALFIVIFSTVTTTFLDAYSGGVSIVNLSGKISEKAAALSVCAAGTTLAIFVPISQYENFLYLIGSVFAPLFAILLTDYYLFGITDVDKNIRLNVKNALIWVLGFAFYRFLLYLDPPIGVTLPTMIAVCALCITVHFLFERRRANV